MSICGEGYKEKALLLLLGVIFFFICSKSMLTLSFSLAALILYLFVKFSFPDMKAWERQTILFISILHLVITVLLVLYMPPIMHGDANHSWYLKIREMLLFNEQHTLYNFIVRIFRYSHERLYAAAIPSDFTLFQCLISSINIILIFYFGTKVHSKKLGIVSAIISAIWIPYLEFASTMLLTETFAISFAILIMSKLSDCLREQKNSDFAYFGVIIGIAFLLKYGFYVWFLSINMIFIVYSVVKRKNILKGIFIYLAIFYLISSVASIRNYYFYGSRSIKPAGHVTFDASVNPYPGVIPKSTLNTHLPYEALDSSKTGTGSVYSIPLTTFFNVSLFADGIAYGKITKKQLGENPFMEKAASIIEDNEWEQSDDFLKLRKRTKTFVEKYFGPLNEEEMRKMMNFYKYRYGISVRGKKWFSLAMNRYKSMAFSPDIYVNTLHKMWDYIVNPTFGRFAGYYYFAKKNIKPSKHYISPLLIFFEHYSFLFFTVVGFFGYFFHITKEKKWPPPEIIAFGVLTLLHLVGFSLAHIPESRYIFPITPFLFLITAYGIIESLNIVSGFLRKWREV